jgi:hypothetical protein
VCGDMVEERGVTFSSGVPPVALADSLTRGYYLKPLRGYGDGYVFHGEQEPGLTAIGYSGPPATCKLKPETARAKILHGVAVIR